MKLIRCRVCRRPGDECETFAKIYLDPPRTCSICAVPLRCVYLSGPFFGGHEGEVIAWECGSCDSYAPKVRRERGANR